MIVLDTNILLYAKGAEHPLREPCRRVVAAIAEGRVRATTTPEVVQEFVHVRARRRTRADAAELGRAYVDLLSPLLVVRPSHVWEGLRLFERHTALGAFDAVLAAVAIDAAADAILSADSSFAHMTELTWLDPLGSAFDEVVPGPR